MILWRVCAWSAGAHNTSYMCFLNYYAISFGGCFFWIIVLTLLPVAALPLPHLGGWVGLGGVGGSLQEEVGKQGLHGVLKYKTALRCFALRLGKRSTSRVIPRL